MTNRTELMSYIKRISDSYASKNVNNVLTSFRVMTPEYQQFNEDTRTQEYSYDNYVLCPEVEQQLFVDSELSTFESLVTNSIYDKYGRMLTWKTIFDLILDPAYKNTDKIHRKVVYSSALPNRPIGDAAYDSWNGLQIIDLDIKNTELSKSLKPILFQELKKYHWFLGICTSASGKSLHVWTKITPISIKHESRRIEYLCNFRHKYSYIYIVLAKYCKRFEYTEDNILTFMDMAMAKPQQGIFITSDENALMSTNFLDRRLDVNFEPALNMGTESVDWISHPALNGIFSKLEWFNNDTFDKGVNIELADVQNTSERDINKNTKKHYKHAQRWQLANTLTNIYGYDTALKYMLEICKDTPYRELKGDVKTAQIHHKPLSVWAIKQLNQFHGFNIKFDAGTNIYQKSQEKIEEINKLTVEEQPTGLTQLSNTIVFNISSNQYLSDIKTDIINNLSHITLLEAGAGYGKTEMIKALKARTCLILPFTSTIKSKIEKSEVTKDWLYYYGNKRPTLEEILGDKNMAMTVDKFSRLNVMELDQAGFEYIVIDESHLLFTSSYRDVMAPTIQRLANCKAKIIMMTGTPTGELTFFPGIKHIKVIKEDNRIKSFDIHFCQTKLEQCLEMCKMMAQDIYDGNKVLFPTNAGNLYYDKIIGLVQEYLEKLEFNRPLRAFYYKKSNYGDEVMDNINFNKTIGNNDMIACTTYLSVGVDICDKYKFSVYFNTKWIPQDIEQFANRLRNNDLFVKMFLPKVDETGMPINYYTTVPLDLSFSEEDLLFARDLIRTCNDMIERNNEESKSNPLIQSLISANKFLKYDENRCKYFIDETMYKLKVFEDRYSAYNTQLKVMLEGLRYYGYTISQVDHKEIISDERRAEVEEYVKNCRKKRYDEMTAETFNLINSINENNIDIYKEIMKGNLDIVRGKDEKNTRIREDNVIYTESIEILEKNIPIILSLYKNYNISTIKDIYKYCLDTNQNRINYTKLNRIRKFIHIISSIKHNRLDFPIYKFVTDAKRFSIEHPILTNNELQKFLTSYATRIANNVKNVVVDDVKYLKTVYDHVIELWNTIIIQSATCKGKVSLRPFELLWETKDVLDDVYGNSLTKEFFLQELISEGEDVEVQHKDIGTIDINVELPEIELTDKKSFESVKDEVLNSVSAKYGYYDYSTADGSNDRFMEKQRNTNMLRDNILPHINTEESSESPDNLMDSLFNS